MSSEDTTAARSDFERGVVPPGRYAQGARSPIVWVLLCSVCAGFAPTTAEDYRGFLSGQCAGCGTHVREMHRFKAWIDSATGCRCSGSHDRVVGDVDVDDAALAGRVVVDLPAGAHVMEHFGVDADYEAGGVYVSLNHYPVARTEAFGDGVNVDYDADGVPVGVEILRSASVPGSSGEVQGG